MTTAEQENGEPTTITIGHKNGSVYMNCDACDGVPPHWHGWTPAQARDLARKLESAANGAEGIELQ
jgi:hypothetical protein